MKVLDVPVEEVRPGLGAEPLDASFLFLELSQHRRSVIHFCLSTTSTTVTSARYPSKASTIITYALFAKVFSLHSPTSPRTRWTSCKRAIVDDDSVHFNGLINRYSDGVCRRCRYNLCVRTTMKEVSQTSERDKTCTCHLTNTSHHSSSVSHFLCDLTRISPYQTAS